MEKTQVKRHLRKTRKGNIIIIESHRRTKKGFVALAGIYNKGRNKFKILKNSPYNEYIIVDELGLQYGNVYRTIKDAEQDNRLYNKRGKK